MTFEDENTGLGVDAHGNSINVMIVDDTLTMRMILKQFLLSAKFNVIAEEDNGKAAVETYKKLRIKPEFIFMDIEMPEMDGIAASKEIRDIDPNIKIIIVSSSQDAEKVKEAISNGAIGYIVKPYDRDKLMHRIAKAIGKELTY